MSKLNAITRIGAITVVVGALAVAPGASTKRARALLPKRPNVLIIVTDDQAANSLRVLPQTRKAFGHNAVRYTNAYATTPLCCPSRASIFTGLYAHNHHVTTNGKALTLDHKKTMEFHLGKAGYDTYIAGKYLSGWNTATAPPFFDRWAIFNDEAGDDGYYNETWNMDGSVKQIPGYTTTVIGRTISGYLEDAEAHDDTPWLMYAFPFGPHPPFTSEKTYRHADVPRWSPNPGVKEKTRNDKPPWVLEHHVSDRKAKTIYTDQSRSLMSVDDMVAKIFSRLKSLNERNRTVVAFSSDNGYLQGEHALDGKRWPYQESVRVPLLLRWADKLAGGRNNKLVANIDIAPTVYHAARLTPRPTTDGISLLKSHVRKRLLLEYFSGPRKTDGVRSWASTVTHDYQYVEYHKGRHVRFKEYYDLRHDPFELLNLFEDGEPGNVPGPARLKSVLWQDMSCSAGNCP